MPSLLTRFAAFLGMLAFLTTGLVVAGTASASASTWAVPVSADTSVDPLANLDEFENRIMIRINQARRSADLRPVRSFDGCLDGLSERWAVHLADLGELVHRSQSPILDRCHLTWAGETLIQGTGLTPGEVVKAWLHSPGHRAVIMKPRANRAGVGVRIDDQGRIVGVLNFGDVN